MQKQMFQVSGEISINNHIIFLGPGVQHPPLSPHKVHASILPNR